MADNPRVVFKKPGNTFTVIIAMADVYVTSSNIHGIGVFAGRAFTAGETIMILDDSRVVDESHPLDSEKGEFDYHCDYLAGGRVILMPSPERHINSSCDPNAFFKTIDDLRHVIAIRDIKADEEITGDYIINCHGGIVWQCACGSPRCRGTIVSGFFELPTEMQLENLRFLDDWFIEEHREKVEALRKKAVI